MSYYILQEQNPHTSDWSDMQRFNKLDEAKNELSKARDESSDFEYRIVLEMDE